MLLLGSCGLLNLVHNFLDLLADLGSVGGELLCQILDPALQEGAQLLGGGLKLGLEDLSLALQLLAQPLSLALEHGGDITQPLAGGVPGALDVGLNVLPGGLQVLGGAGLDLAQIGGHSAEGTTEGLKLAPCVTT